MLTIKPAVDEDFIPVREFYFSLIEQMENAEFNLGWKKNIYPSQKFLQDSIRNEELFIALTDDGIIAASMVVNHQYNNGYNKIKWSVDADDSQVLVIHALGVRPDYSGKGIAKQMVRQVIDTAKKSGIKAFRLDILSGNIPAEKAYTKVGFEFRGAVKMFYEDTGWTEYKLFEYDVK